MAEFTEVMRQRERMCKFYGMCMEATNECPLYGANDCNNIIRDNIEDAERTIMQWAAVHPVMTNAQKFKEVFGCEIHRGGCDCIGIEHECIYNGFNGICQKCEWKGFWGKEYKEPEVK